MHVCLAISLFTSPSDNGRKLRSAKFQVRESSTDLEYIMIYIWIMSTQNRKYMIIPVYKFCHIFQNIKLSLVRKLMNILSLSSYISLFKKATINKWYKSKDSLIPYGQGMWNRLLKHVTCVLHWERGKAVCHTLHLLKKKQTKAKMIFVWGTRIRKVWKASFFYLFLISRILYMHTVCFDYIGPLFLPYNLSPTHPQPLLFTPNIMCSLI